MSPTGQGIRVAVMAAVRRVRRDGLLAAALAVGAILPAALLLALAWGPGGKIARGAGPLVFLTAAAAAAVGLGVWLGRRWVRTVNEAAVAAAAERRRGLADGSLRGVLELGREPSPGASGALVRHGEAELAARLAGFGAADLAGDLGDRARRRRWRAAAVAGALTGITVLAAFGAPERARGAWAPLLSPVAMLSAPSLPPLVVRPGDADVARGTALEVFVEAPFRDRVAIRWRATGDVPRARTLPLEGGAGSLSLGPVNAPLVYWIEAPDGAISDSFRVRPLDPLLVSGLTVEVIYPAHVGREPDTYGGETPPLLVPEGSRIRAWGGATRPLRSIALVRSDGREVAGQARGSGFDLEWRPDVEDSGLWAWRLSGAGASSEASPPPPLDLTVVADQPPIVRITSPEPDRLMPATLRQPVVADASDDHGLAAASLVYQRVTSAGERGPEQAVPLRVEAGADRLLLRAMLDASGASLVPGDAVHYRVVVRDNSPAGQTASSAEHVLRLPGMAELRDRAREQAADAMAEAERVAERTRDLQTATRDLSRQAAGRPGERRPGAETGRGSQPSQLGFEEAREAAQVLDEQETLLGEMAALEERMAALQRAVEEAGLRDPELQRRLEELRALYDELASPEMDAQVDRLREAIESLDPAAVREALEQLAAQQEEIRERMEESLELMRRAAAEQEMAALAREAEALSAEQEALAEAMREDAAAAQPPEMEGQRAVGEPPSAEDSAGTPALHPPGAQPPTREENQPQPQTPPEGAPSSQQPQPSPQQAQQAQPAQPASPEQRAEQQEEMAERAQRLNESMQQLQQQLLQIGEREAAQSTGSAQQKGKSAQQSMQQAAEQARDQQGNQASQSGAQAASQMGQAAQQLESARQSMTEGWEREVREAVQQATQDALSLAQREEALRRQMEQAQQQGSGQGQGQMLQQMRSEQAALQQGLQQLGRNLSDAGQQSGMVNRDVSQALARAMLNMEQTLRGMGEQGQMPVQQAGQTVESLNQLAMSLLQNDAQMQQRAGDPMQQALEQLAQLAREQGAVNGQAGALAPMDLGRQTMAQQLQQLAQRQRGIARRVGSVSEMMGGRENVLGQLDQLSSEAELIAQAMEGGRLDPEVRTRQERLFNRLLDAGRSLEREEYSDERVGESGAGVEASSPDALDPALLDPTLRYPAPAAARLRALPPAYRRLILEYFDRLNRGGGSAPAGPAGAASEPPAGASGGGA